MTKQTNFFQLCSLWSESVRYQVKPSTYGVYLTMLEKHILPDLGDLCVSELGNKALDNYFQEKQNQKLSWNTLRLIVFLLKAILQMGEDLGMRPAERLHYHVSKYKKSAVRVIGHDNTERLLRYLEDSERVFDLGLLISVCTGIRVGELCGLQWGDVNWSGGTIRINRTVSRIRNAKPGDEPQGRRHPGEDLSKTVIYIGTPKTGTSIREIPLPDFLILKMLRYRKDEGSYILTGKKKCMEPRGVQRRFKNLLRKRSIPEINIHALRHAFASRWIENGFDSKALSEILGHSSVKITMDIYVHSNIEQKKLYMNRMV